EVLNPHTLCRFERKVSGCAWALVLAEFNDLPGVLEALRQLITHDRHRVVLRTVIRNDEFKMRVCLSCQVIDCAGNPSGRVIRRHDDADQVHGIFPLLVNSKPWSTTMMCFRM